eukprot:359358-Chlamydomonas_euryale.AAC.6
MQSMSSAWSFEAVQWQIAGGGGKIACHERGRGAPRRVSRRCAHATHTTVPSVERGSDKVCVGGGEGVEVAGRPGRTMCPACSGAHATHTTVPQVECGNRSPGSSQARRGGAPIGGGGSGGARAHVVMPAASQTGSSDGVHTQSGGSSAGGGDCGGGDCGSSAGGSGVTHASSSAGGSGVTHATPSGAAGSST